MNYGLLIRLFDFELVLIEGHEILCFTREQLLQLKEVISDPRLMVLDVVVNLNLSHSPCFLCAGNPSLWGI